MDEQLSSPLTPFAWVTKRDGRLVPFEADRISRALFAATETLGKPDAFLARELTDVILHFLAGEAEGTPAAAQIAELVIKVVRELGHPVLAQAFAEGAETKHAARALPPSEFVPRNERLEEWVEEATASVPLIWRTGGACLREYSLRHVFTRDLAAAHSAGLLALTGLEAPLELAACVLDPQAVGCGPWAVGERLIEAIEGARHAAGVFLAIDSPEYGIAHCPQTTVEYARDLHTGLKANGLPAVLNLNCAAPPIWADDLAEGPLFADYRQAPTPELLADLADTLLEEMVIRHRRLAGGAPVGTPCFRAPVRVDWHLGPRDFAPESAGRLARAARWVTEDAPLAFVFDRPKRPVALAEGLDRRNTALLLTVGINFLRLAELVPQPTDSEVLLQKLSSLVRLALSAAVQKREFLRGRTLARPALARGFLLDRARVVLVPLGLDALVRKLFGTGLCAGGAGLDFGRRVTERLRAILRQDAPAHHLEWSLDGPAAAGLDDTLSPAGLTPWDITADPAGQVRAGGTLHDAAEGGTLAVLLPSASPETVVHVLRQAWGRTGILRLRFERHPDPQRQRTATWAGETLSV